MGKHEHGSVTACQELRILHGDGLRASRACLFRGPEKWGSYSTPQTTPLFLILYLGFLMETSCAQAALVYFEVNLGKQDPCDCMYPAMFTNNMLFDDIRLYF